MRVYDRDLIRGGHYGQRSCEPHLQAEHMAAPTNAAKREESSCQLGAVHTWHFSGMARCPQAAWSACSAFRAAATWNFCSIKSTTETVASHRQVHTFTALSPISA